MMAEEARRPAQLQAAAPAGGRQPARAGRRPASLDDAVDRRERRRGRGRSAVGVTRLMHRQILRLPRRRSHAGSGVRADSRAVRDARSSSPPRCCAAAEQAARAARPPPVEPTCALWSSSPSTRGSLDLDQAMQLERRDGGYRVRYAIADVAAFVERGGAIEAEAWRRGETVYCPDTPDPPYPTVLSENAASLLPGADRPAVVFTIDLDETATDRGLRCNGRWCGAAKFDYAGLRGERRSAAAADRGAATGTRDRPRRFAVAGAGADDRARSRIPTAIGSSWSSGRPARTGTPRSRCWPGSPRHGIMVPTTSGCCARWRASTTTAWRCFGGAPARSGAVAGGYVVPRLRPLTRSGQAA